MMKIASVDDKVVCPYCGHEEQLTDSRQLSEDALDAVAARVQEALENDIRNAAMAKQAVSGGGDHVSGIIFSILGILGLVGAFLFFDPFQTRVSPDARREARERMEKVIAEASNRDEKDAATVMEEPAVGHGKAGDIGEGGPAGNRQNQRGAGNKAVPAADRVAVLSNTDARRVLEPEILGCMTSAGVHSLIVRIGQGNVKYSAGPLPPLTVVNPGDTWVDYRKETGFHRSALGKCILHAAQGIQTNAIAGNYMHFHLKNSAVPDPLAGLPDRLDGKAAQTAAERMDMAAQDCAVHHSDSAEPRKTLSIQLTFLGVDGSVSAVKPMYIDAKTSWAQCLKAAYLQVKGPRFRDLEATYMHRLSPR
jgi:uncharacterized Zn finger protein (UPF0148 family)